MDQADKTAPPAIERKGVDRLDGRGKTLINDEVVSVIARIAAEQIEGVHQIGSSSLRGVFSRGRHVGVEAEVGLKQAAVDIDLVVTYGFPIPEVASALRRQIIEQVEYMTGRQVVEVNVNVVDVHVPRSEAPKQQRRQLE